MECNKDTSCGLRRRAQSHARWTPHELLFSWRLRTTKVATSSVGCSFHVAQRWPHSVGVAEPHGAMCRRFPCCFPFRFRFSMLASTPAKEVVRT